MCGRRSRKKKFPFGIVILSVLIVVAMVGVGVGYWVLIRDTSSADVTQVAAGTEIPVVIEQGTSVAGIAETLEEAGVISSAITFRGQVRLAGADDTLLAGSYLMYAGMSHNDIIAMLQAGPPRQDVVRVTIPEGRSIDRMALILAEEMNFTADEFTQVAKSGAPEFAGEFPFLIGAFDDSLEGYLFPDSYEFFQEATVHEVITQMLQRFQYVWNSLEDPTGAATEMTPEELVVLASLVEMESSLERERPLVSSVIYNRLAINRKLQFCSTVQFLMPGEDRQRLRLTYAETQVPSPYNTYLNEGLPPGPISNPGRQALDAALHPADTDYIYFVLTGEDGSQTFASNTAEFERARQLSREVFGQ
ncbi:MAG: endolytic transglycosylase MltG [Coriobacteriia bacterium]|nr:endolytic transglycosylase MltG [Coriobacteriia bacterium]MCL2871255.1 endolytic transglycosylase MltG [Coriobacteriia bacterium]